MPRALASKQWPVDPITLNHEVTDTCPLRRESLSLSSLSLPPSLYLSHSFALCFENPVLRSSPGNCTRRSEDPWQKLCSHSSASSTLRLFSLFRSVERKKRSFRRRELGPNILVARVTPLFRVSRVVSSRSELRLTSLAIVNVFVAAAG